MLKTWIKQNDNVLDDNWIVADVIRRHDEVVCRLIGWYSTNLSGEIILRFTRDTHPANIDDLEQVVIAELVARELSGEVPKRASSFPPRLARRIMS
jgi:hypothetical protein